MSWGRQLRAVLAARFWLIAGALVVATVVGAGVSYTVYAQQGTEIVEQPGPSATYTGEFRHRATVQRETPVFSTDQTLSNRSVYFSRITPVLNGTFRYGYTATTTGNLSVDSTVTLTIAAVGPDEQSPTVYWRERRRLAQESAVLDPGESLALSFSRNVTALTAEYNRIEAAVGTTPGTMEATIVAEIRANGTVNGRPVSRTQEYVLGLTPADDIYRVADPGTVTNSTDQTRRVSVPASPGPLRRLGGPALGLAGVCGLIGLGVARSQGLVGLDETEEAFMTYEADRAEFDDWITRAELPAAALDGPTVEVATLSGLVDTAIDTERRVIETGDREYVVVGEALIYRYTAPPEPGRADDGDQRNDPPDISIYLDGTSEEVETGETEPAATDEQ